MKKVHIGPAAIIASISLMACMPISHVNGDNKSVGRNWSEVRQLLVDRANSIHSIRALFTINTYFPQEVRERVSKEWRQAKQETRSKATPFPNDANLSEGFFWITDGTRWRCDKVRYYPATGSDTDRYIFDGEKYYIFDSYQDTAFIESTPQKARPLYYATSNDFLGLLFGPMSVRQEKEGWLFKAAGHEMVNDYECLKFEALLNKENPKTSRISLWVSPDHGYAIVKHKQEFFIPPDKKRVRVYNFLKLQMFNDIFLPTEAYEQRYEIIKGKINWNLTRQFFLTEAQLNRKIDSGYFKDVLPVGTPLVDGIEEPGKVSRIGGVPGEVIERAWKGNPPLIQEPEKELEIKKD